MKRIAVVLAIISIFVASVSYLCSASYTVQAMGCNHVYEASYEYDQGWARVHANNKTYTVIVGVIRNGVIYGQKATIASAGYTTYCASYKVLGSGGVVGLNVN